MQRAGDFLLEKAENIQHIELNPDAELYPDIESIVHSPDHRLLRVLMKENARCSNPFFRGRLSGRALAIVKWKKEGPRTFYGKYKAPLAGDFFLEIISVFCNYVPDDMKRCLVPGESFRVTADAVEIRVTQTSIVKGYWASPVYEPLYTRWQPQNCRGEEKTSDRCASVGTVKTIDNYEFMTHSKVTKELSKFDSSSSKSGTWKKVCFGNAVKPVPCLEDESTPKCDLCMWGASHSLRLAQWLQILVGIRMGRFTRHMPDMYKPKHITKFMERCKTVVIGFGQWPLSFGNTTQEFTDMIRTLLKELEHHPHVVGRSVHYNPEGDEKLMCPPMDNRNVAYTDDYNNAMKELYAEFGREWIDTRWVDGPLWDFNHDWNHLHHKVEVAEAFTVADRLGFLDGDYPRKPDPMSVAKLMKLSE
eukprot:CAMPEP_0172493618 /NCGR_PEP_ID=MMETSP1066-20121228/25026_1 /TAXON_ID=671091 /ORGANISM="Coscinodiscus wailesii, Strain CCMP2513" /LENGTH=417 /DNA_ID=CAMNT_0013263841 /DNA_START=428 /DNA_END=1681 /DNA_ORIENTATION=+